ncbi:hypothetical protein MHN79_11630 [Vibrio sp. Of14-4]|uniref:hypothetical protein n=1 Tax=Vibrio sp. Of14-4 TaxID=2724878 RepID=UPI001EF37037|nr:hypothetical protein [Vibrio sp. Of14-4]MCG7490143.1 hypothetical protein [Vibrio sp. Of14-4]
MVMPLEVANSRLSQVNSYSDANVSKDTEFHKFDVSQVPLSTYLDPAVSAKQEKDLSLIDSHLSHTHELMEKSAQLYQQAEKAGVDVAKSTFFKELFNVVIAGAGLGLAVAATVISGGLGIPLTVAAGIALTLAVSDAGCAYHNWSKAENGEQGLRMGSDTLSNLVYALLDKMGMQDERAEHWARASSATLRLGLTIGTLYAGTVSVPSSLGAATSAISTTKMARLGISATGNEMLGFHLGSSKINHDKAKAELDAHKTEVAVSFRDSMLTMREALHKKDTKELAEENLRLRIKMDPQREQMERLKQKEDQFEQLRAMKRELDSIPYLAPLTS